MLVRIFVIKLVKNERKILTHHETIDRMAEQVKSVITHVRKESKLWIHRNLRWPIFSVTFSFKFSYFCIADIWTLKGIKTTAIKTTTNYKNLSQIYITGFKKAAHAVRNSEWFRIWSKKLYL